MGFITAEGAPPGPLLREAVSRLIGTNVHAELIDKWDIRTSAIAGSEPNPKPSV